MNSTTSLNCLKHSMLILSIAGMSALTFSSSEVEAKTLQNDGWMDMTAAGFQGGFAADEIGSAVFVPDLEDYPIRLQKVQLLFGGDQEGVTREMVFMVWKDVGTPAPGELLYEEELEFTASSQAFSEVDLSGTGITIDSGNVRVGLKFKHTGFPGIARDDDPGSANDFPSRNHIFAQGVGWARSADFGVLGDWIIRLDVATSGGGSTTMSNTSTSNTSTSNTNTSNSTSNTSTSNSTVDGDPLAISVINPYKINEGEETTVTVLGQGFETGVTVRIGATPLSQVIVQSSEAIIGTVPDDISPGVYDVTVNLGTEQVVLNQGFEVVAAEPEVAPSTDDGCSVTATPVKAPWLTPVAALMFGALVAFRRRG